MRVEYEGDVWDVCDPDAIPQVKRYLDQGLTRREFRIAMMRVATNADASKKARGDFRDVLVGWRKVS